MKLALSSVLILAACQQQPVTRDEAIQLANEYAVRRFDSYLNGMVPHAEDAGGNWIVTYTFEPPMPGGTPTLAVDKQTREIRLISHSQ